MYTALGLYSLSATGHIFTNSATTCPIPIPHVPAEMQMIV